MYFINKYSEKTSLPIMLHSEGGKTLCKLASDNAVKKTFLLSDITDFQERWYKFLTSCTSISSSAHRGKLTLLYSLSMFNMYYLLLRMDV